MSETGTEVASHAKRRWKRRCEPATLRAGWLALALCLPWLTPAAMAQTPSRTELQKLSVATNAGFATAIRSPVALSDDRALIGASGDDGPGAAYVYERDGTGKWVEVAKLTPLGAENASFGHSLALSGDRALIGAPGNDGPGAAYVYERDGTGKWVEVAKLSPLDAENASFGRVLALSGDRALIGSHVYERDGTGTWAEVAELAFPDPYGYGTDSVALSGDRALIGRSLENATGTTPASGAAYLYERDGTGTWVEVARLTALDAAARNYFGTSVQLSGDRALVGAYSSDGAAVRDSGAAYVYERDGAGMWVQVARLTASDGREHDLFGISVALLGDRALIGASRANATYVYERDGAGTWVEVSRLVASDGAPGDRFGSAVALSDDWALVRAPISGSGPAYVFSVAAGNDRDGDEVVDVIDNCPADWNPLQENFDEDPLGDACDPDDDNDGLDDAYDPFPLDPDRTLPPLVLDQVDSTEYGFRFEGIDSHRDVLVRQFDASGADLSLTLSGYDIDRADEVRVRVNGVQIGFLSRTPDNGRATTRLSVARSLLRSTGNTLRFRQTRRGWRWGVTDLLLSEAGELPPLVLDQVDSTEYGFRFEGINSHRVVLERQFEASGADLSLTLSGYDIDRADEVRVLVNGTPIGFLSKTPDNGRATSQLTIARSLLDSAGNTLRFEQANPGWIWGVTELLLSDGGTRSN